MKFIVTLNKISHLRQIWNNDAVNIFVMLKKRNQCRRIRQSDGKNPGYSVGRYFGPDRPTVKRWPVRGIASTSDGLPRETLSSLSSPNLPFGERLSTRGGGSAADRLRRHVDRDGGRVRSELGPNDEALPCVSILATARGTYTTGFPVTSPWCITSIISSGGHVIYRCL